MGIDRLLISPRTSVERNEELGCLAGVLEGVGDNICTFDMSFTGGSKILNGYRPAFDELCSRMGHGEDINCGEPDEGRPSRPVRRAGISRPYYHYAFAMLLGSTPFVTFSRMWDSLSSWVDNRSSFIFIVSCFYNNKSSQE
ncbi:hypothetical protein IFM89_020731 [Coptis chinensis]|uniref:Uncharacterized protein n=1 Tax=Coptis chinensis TaxID=261450 RepID=A0A835IDY8_9MAGN|nr:hypothetical protein IFM89_020731 [Coptis chinensis]